MYYMYICNSQNEEQADPDIAIEPAADPPNEDSITNTNTNEQLADSTVCRSRYDIFIRCPSNAKK